MRVTSLDVVKLFICWDCDYLDYHCVCKVVMMVVECLLGNENLIVISLSLPMIQIGRPY
jgi:hypothetical protein